jgi:hypothetical protein
VTAEAALLWIVDAPEPDTRDNIDVRQRGKGIDWLRSRSNSAPGAGDIADASDRSIVRRVEPPVSLILLLLCLLASVGGKLKRTVLGGRGGCSENDCSRNPHRRLRHAV